MKRYAYFPVSGRYIKRMPDDREGSIEGRRLYNTQLSAALRDGDHSGRLLRAVEYCVFEKEYCTLDQLKAAMKADYEGYEPLRQRLLHAPKYGNGEERVMNWRLLLPGSFWIRWQHTKAGAVSGSGRGCII